MNKKHGRIVSYYFVKVKRFDGEILRRRFSDFIDAMDFVYSETEFGTPPQYVSVQEVY